MANKSALKAAGKRAAKQQEASAYKKRVKYRILVPGWEPDESKAGKKKKAAGGYAGKMIPRNFTVLSQFDWALECSVNKKHGNKSLKPPALCSEVHMAEPTECDYCNSENDDRQNYAQLCKVWIVYCHDFEGMSSRDEKTGKDHAWNPIRCIIANQGKDSGIWEKFIDANEEGVFNKCVFQMSYSPRGLVIRKLSKENRMKLGTKGRVPKEAREEINALSFDEHLAHCLNIFRPDSVDWDHWDVDAPSVSSEEGHDEEDDEDSSYKDDDEDEEDDDDKKSKPRKSKSKSRLGKSRPVKSKDDDEDEDDEDGDEEEEEEDEDEDEDEKPKKKSKSKVKSKSSKKRSKDDDDDEDDSPDPDPDDDEDEDEDDDEDDDDEDEKPSRKSKSKAKARRR